MTIHEKSLKIAKIGSQILNSPSTYYGGPLVKFGGFLKNLARKKHFFSNMRQKLKNLTDNFLGMVLVHYQLNF